VKLLGLTIGRVGERVWPVLLAALLVSCLGGSVGSAYLADACSSDSQCEGNLICSRGGDLEGICTEECQDDQVCEAKHGDFAYCADGLCVLMCGVDAHCSPEARCGGSFRTGDGFCILR